jgi:hypothetical protein
MSKEQPISSAEVRKIGVVVVLVLILVLLGLSFASYSEGVPTARLLASYVQSGTQVYFDEETSGQGLYGARVTAYKSGRQLLFGGQKYVLGSSLPDTSETERYPIVAAGSFSFRRGTHFGTLTNEVYRSKNTPALILNPGTGGFEEAQGTAVRTVNANMGPLAGKNYGLKLATHVHVHPGLSAESRGSTACLTIAPDQAQMFFGSEIGKTGTVHIRR